MKVGFQAGMTLAVNASVALEWLEFDQELDRAECRQIFVYSDNVESLRAAIRAFSTAGRHDTGLFFPGDIGSMLAMMPVSLDFLVTGGSSGEWKDDYLAASSYFGPEARLVLHGVEASTARLNAPYGQIRVLSVEEATPFTSIWLEHACAARRSLSESLFRQSARDIRELLENREEGIDRESLAIVTRAAKRELLGSQQSLRGKMPVFWPYRSDGKEMPETLPDGSRWPVISVVTPSCNCGKYLEQTILSVLNQNYPAVEFILIDGGSTDQTGEILDRYRQELSYCISEKDRGQSHAINKGFSRATGEICTWLNADDMLAPGALYAMAFAFWQSGADVVAGVCEILRDGAVVEEHLTSAVPGKLDLEDLTDISNRWLKGAYFYQPEVFFRRDLWERAGGAVSESLHYVMDYDMWLRFAAAGATFAVTGAPIAMFRVHPEQKTYTPDRYLSELRETAEKYLKAPCREDVTDAGLDSLRICFIDFPRREERCFKALGELLGRAGHAVHYMRPGAQGVGVNLEAGVLMPEEIDALLGEDEPDVYVLSGVGDDVLRQAAAFEGQRGKLILLFDTLPTAETESILVLMQGLESPAAIAASSSELAKALGGGRFPVAVVGNDAVNPVAGDQVRPACEKRMLGIPSDGTVVYWPGEDLTIAPTFQRVLTELSSAMIASDTLVTDVSINCTSDALGFGILDLASRQADSAGIGFADAIVLEGGSSAGVALAAAASGIPVLCAAAKEAVTDRSSQLVYDPETEGSLAFSLSRLLHSGSLRKTLSLYQRLEAGRKLSPAACLRPLHLLLLDRVKALKPNLKLARTNTDRSVQFLEPATGFGFGRNVGPSRKNTLLPGSTAYRRLIGPSCQIRYRDVEAGKRTLFISLGCSLPFQSVRVLLNQKAVGYFDVPISTEVMPEFPLFIPVTIETDNTIELEFSRVEGVGPNKGASCNLTAIAFLRLG